MLRHTSTIINGNQKKIIIWNEQPTKWLFHIVDVKKQVKLNQFLCYKNIKSTYSYVLF